MFFNIKKEVILKISKILSISLLIFTVFTIYTQIMKEDEIPNELTESTNCNYSFSIFMGFSFMLGAYLNQSKLIKVGIL